MGETNGLKRESSSSSSSGGRIDMPMSGLALNSPSSSPARSSNRESSHSASEAETSVSRLSANLPASGKRKESASSSSSSSYSSSVRSRDVYTQFTSDVSAAAVIVEEGCDRTIRFFSRTQRCKLQLSFPTDSCSLDRAREDRFEGSVDMVRLCFVVVCDS